MVKSLEHRLCCGVLRSADGQRDERFVQAEAGALGPEHLLLHSGHGIDDRLGEQGDLAGDPCQVFHRVQHDAGRSVHEG